MKTFFYIITGISVIIWLITFKPDTYVHLLLIPGGILLVKNSFTEMKFTKKNSKKNRSHKQKY